MWHQDFISLLPRPQLLGQHRECCALRGNGWGKKHATVNYVFDYSPYCLFAYHQLIMEEMTRRGYKVSEEWLQKGYRGKTCLAYENLVPVQIGNPIYPEHDADYRKECLDNLAEKGIFLDLKTK
nr:TIGR02328 family protein [Streptococcus gallinaceus]